MNRSTQSLAHLEVIRRDCIAGWAFNPLQPDRQVRLALYDGPSHLITFSANTFRPDLLAAGFGDGRHGFHLAIPAHLADRQILDLRLVDEDDGAELVKVTVTTTDERFAAVQHAVEESVPHFLRGLENPVERLDWTRLYLATLMGATVRLFADLRALLETLNAGSGASEAESLPDGVAFDRVVGALLRRFPQLRAKTTELPLVSVVIPAFNKFEYTYECVKSLLDVQCPFDFEIIIVDDNSSDETLLAPLLLPGVNVLRNERNLGFVGSCNRGAAAARGTHLFFLNNDTKVHDDALSALVDAFALHEKVGIAGSKLLFDDGKLQEAGGIIWRMGDGWNYGRGQDASDPRFNYVRDVDYVSGAALMIPKAVWQEVGGFDPDLAPGYYEDTDLAFRVRAAGYRVIYQPRSVVTHFEGISSGTDLTAGMKRYQVVNGRKFFVRWKHVLAGHRLNGVEPEKEKDRAAKFRVLFVDVSTPTPREDAGSNAALSHMKAIQGLGGKITFVPADNMTHLGQVSTHLQDLGIEFLHHPWFWSVEEVLRKRGAEFDVIYLHRFDVAARYLATCRALAPHARIVYNIADLHFLRLERERAVGAAGAKAEPEIEAVRSQELAAIRAADHVIVHSEVEAALLRERHGIAQVSVIPWVMEGRPGPVPLAERAPRVGFLGGFGHAPNADAVHWFVGEIWPLVRAEMPDAEFLIFGSKMPDDIRALKRVPGVRPIGFVEDVAEAFDQLRVSVAPLRYGAGLKGKVGQSLAYGVPCVGTSCAFEGYPKALWESCVADSVEGLAEKITSLLTDAPMLALVAAAGRALAEAHSSQAFCREALALCLQLSASSLVSSSNVQGGIADLAGGGTA